MFFPYEYIFANVCAMWVGDVCYGNEIEKHSAPIKDEHSLWFEFSGLKLFHEVRVAFSN